MRSLVVVGSFLAGISLGFASLCPDIGFFKDAKSTCYKYEGKSPDGTYRIEEKVQTNIPIIRSKPMKQSYELFRGKAGANWGANGSACGLNVFANYLYGLKTNIKALESFIEDWTQSIPAVALYALATYMPVAKEVLMGAEMLSNAVARLQGFNCQTAMKYIREMNMADSVLVKRCVMTLAKKDGTDVSDYDSLKKTDPDKWWGWYKRCLNEGSVFDLLEPSDKSEWQKKLSLRRTIRCALFGDKPWSEIVKDMESGWTTGSIAERAKVLLYVTAPEFEFSGAATGLGKVKLGGEGISFGSGDTVSDIRSLLDELLNQQLSTDISSLIDVALNAHISCTSTSTTPEACDTLLSDLEKEINTFEKKWNVDLGDTLDELEVIAKIQSAILARADEDPSAYSHLAEFIANIRDEFATRFKKQIYQEIKTQLLMQVDGIVAQLRAQKRLGSSADLCKSSGSAKGD
ncbi:hypothetical protein [Hydrogenivirga sp.]